MLLDKYKIMSFKSLFNPDTHWSFLGIDDKILSFMNMGVDMILGFNNLVWQIVDYGLSTLYSKTIFDGQIGAVFQTTSSLWNTLFDSFKVLFFAIAMFYVVKDFMTKGVQQAFIRLLIFISIFGFNSAFFSSGDYYLKQVSGVSNSIQNEIVDVALLGVNDANVALIDKNSAEYKKLNSTEKMREAFFSIAVFKPFALVNFGELAFDTGIVGPMPDGQTKPAPMAEKDFDKFLVKSSKVYDKAEQQRIDKNVEKSSDIYPYLTGNSMGYKYAVAIGSLSNTLFFGLVIFFLSLLKFVLEIIVLGLCVLLPISALLSLLPPFQGAIFKALGMIVAVFSVKVISGLGIAIVFMFVGIVDSIIPSTSVVGFFAGLVVKVLLIVLIWKNRQWLAKFTTGNRVNLTNQYTEKFDRGMNQLAYQGAEKGLEFAENVGYEAKSFLGSQVDNVRGGIEDSGSAIRDRAILSSAKDLQENEWREPIQLNQSDVLYSDVSPIEDENGFTDYSETMPNTFGGTRKEVSEEVGFSQVENNGHDSITSDSHSRVILDDSSEIEEELEDGRIDQRLYYYSNFEEVSPEFIPEEITLPEERLNHDISVESVVHNDFDEQTLTPEELPTEQTMQVTERIEVNRNVEDTIRQEVPVYEDGQIDQELPVMELNGLEEGGQDETS